MCHWRVVASAHARTCQAAPGRRSGGCAHHFGDDALDDDLVVVDQQRFAQCGIVGRGDKVGRLEYPALRSKRTKEVMPVMVDWPKPS